MAKFLTFALWSIASKGEDLLAKVLSLLISQVGIAGQQSACLQVAGTESEGAQTIQHYTG